jgi:hypothetical protein
MTQAYRLGTHRTTVSSDGKWMRVVYHHTPVVKWTPKTIILNTGGWFTTTTKRRMNQASNQFSLGYHIYQKKYGWYVKYKGKIYKFKGNKLRLHRWNKNVLNAVDRCTNITVNDGEKIRIIGDISVRMVTLNMFK